MPDVAEPVKPYTFDKSAFESKLNDVQEQVQKLAGHPRFNPFMWHKSVVAPLLKRYNSGEQSKELFDAVNNLTVPTPPKPAVSDDDRLSPFGNVLKTATPEDIAKLKSLLAK